MAFQLGIQSVQHQSRFYPGFSLFVIDFEDTVEIFAGIDDQPLADGLSALGSSASTGGDADSLFACNLKCCGDIICRLRDQHPGGNDLVDRGIGAVKPPGKVVEKHFSPGFSLQPFCESVIRW